MKYFMFCFFFFSCFILTAQILEIVPNPQFYDGKTLNQLKQEKLVLEEIRSHGLKESKNKLLALKIRTPKGFIQFFPVNDSTFYSKEKIGENCYNTGHFKLLKNNASNDTIILYNPETFTKTILVAYPLQKVGYWFEYDELNHPQAGNYKKGLRHGKWGGCLNNDIIGGERKNVIYEYGEQIGYYEIGSALLKKKINWLLDKDLVWCKQYYYKTPIAIDAEGNGSSEFPIVEKKAWDFKKTADENCQGLGVFRFKENGTFTYTESEKVKGLKFQEEIRRKQLENSSQPREIFEMERPSLFYASGKGKWKITKDDQVILEFKDKRKEIFKITFFGQDGISLYYEQ